MKKILDKYKIAGHKRHSLFYIVQRDNSSEQNCQLRIELDCSLTHTALLPNVQRNGSAKTQHSVEPHEQLTLIINGDCFTQHSYDEQNVLNKHLPSMLISK
ncbi:MULTISPECIES: hypothetical protein [Bacillus]|uniref:hypothetical protein n=1 Tax=Bacillus TaxID=1386 RepID=UPI0003676800|nr:MULTISPECIES: hypothetical protein [Bacillus]